MIQAARSALLVAVLALLSCATVAQQSEAAPVAFSIEQQPMLKALNAWAQQANLQLIWPAGSQEAQQLSPRVVGRFPPHEALQMLLKGSALESTMVDAQTFEIKPVRASTQKITWEKEEPTPPLQVAQASGAMQKAVAPPSELGPKDSTNSSEKKTIDEIVVTGSLLRSADAPIAQVTTLDREDIERSGVATTEALLRTIPQNFGGGGTATNFSTPSPEAQINDTGATGIDLLGLGSGATLTLLNGMRLAPSAFGSFVDVSNIPLTAIERVEVLTDGASATYGSDAVAGVVNFILRRDYEGAETRVRYGGVTEGSSDEIRLTQTLGNVWSRGNVMLNYEFYDASRLSASDRSFASQAPMPLDLVPAMTKHSVLLSGSATLTDNLELRGDALYGHRVLKRSYGQAGTLVVANRQGTADAYAGNINLTAQLQGDWRAVFAAGFSRADETTDQSNVPAVNPPSRSGQRSGLGSIEARADGPLLDAPGGALTAAIGINARRDEFSGTTTAGRGLKVDLSRSTKAVFSELRVPLVSHSNAFAGVKRLELSAAARYEDYSDFGSSTNPKVAVLWSPFGDLNIRAGWGKSFNAPRLEYASPYSKGGLVANFLEFGVGPLPAPFTNRALVVQDYGVDPGLGPERSENWNMGVEWASARGLRVHATYFDISYRDRIGQPATSAVPLLTDPVAYAAFIQLNPSPADVSNLIQSLYSFNDFTTGFDPSTQIDAILNTRTTNLAETHTTGLNFGIDVTPGVFNEKLTIAISGLRFFKYENQARSAAPAIDILDSIYNPVSLRLRGQATWSSGPFASTISLNYTDSYKDNQQTPDRSIASWTTVDAVVSFNFDHLRMGSGLSLALSATNLLDRDPPSVVSNAFNAFGYDPANASALGRFLAVELKKAW